MRHVTTRLVLLLISALLVITGVYDYVRLTRERAHLIEVRRADLRIFAETLALAVRHNVRRGRTTGELQELLDEIRSRPGLFRVAIFDPNGQMVAASATSGGTAGPVRDDVIEVALRSGTPSSSLAAGDKEHVLRYVQPFKWSDGRM